MALSIEIPRVSYSFRPEYSTRPAGFLTPPRPSFEIEPFSPTTNLSPHTDLYHSDSRKRTFQEANLLDGANDTNSRKRQALQEQFQHTHFRDNNSTTYRTASSPSALEVFAAVATSPELAQGAFNHHTFATPWLKNRPEASYHGKRSRSEIVDAHTAFDTLCRPATSHVSNPRWSLNSGHIDSWQDRRNRDSAYLHHHSAQERNGGPAEDNMQDAELLLSFALGPKYKPRSRAATHSSVMLESGPSHFRGHHQYSLSKPHDHNGNSRSRETARGTTPAFDYISKFDAIDEESCRYAGQEFQDLTASVRADDFYRLPAVQHQLPPETSREVPCDHHADLHKFINANGTGYRTADDLKQESNDYAHDVHSLPQALQVDAVPGDNDVVKPKTKTKGWPKGKPRGKKSTVSPVKQTHRNKKQATQLPGKSAPPQQPLTNGYTHSHYQPPQPDFESTFRNRARTLSESYMPPPHWSPVSRHRQFSLPIPGIFNDRHARGLQPISDPHLISRSGASDRQGRLSEHDMQSNICTACQSQSSTSGYQDQWIKCNGCDNNWFHTACVGLKNEREVRDIDKFYCSLCERNGFKTTRVRKSNRAHASLDYAGLNQGEVRTATDTVDHHYIRAFKEGTISLTPETFPRMRPEMVTAEFFERSGTMSEPILIPAAWNPRPATKNRTTAGESDDVSAVDGEALSFQDTFDYDCVPDDGQDRLDMVMPAGLTVRAVSEIIGPEEKVEVIDVKSQEGGDGRWNLRKWADYYEASGEKPVRNVISLEVSQTKLGKLIRRPKLVRDLDLQDAVWPQDELAKGAYPQVQFYCLMSVQDCYTDFHIDFGGSSVYYHIMKGSKTFFFIPPKKQHLKAYEQWCKSSNQSAEFLGDITKECYRVDLFEGDTMLIPSGWIHAVWTPTNSLVIGGNFLTRMHYGMQIAINDIEKATGVTRKFRYPSFQKVLWYTVIQYLQDDPVPSNVAQTLYAGQAFERQNPTWDDFELSNADDPAYCHARYYSKGEIEGLVDLMRYIHRTVMISLGKVQGVSKTTTEAVIRSLPRGYGDHLDLLKIFALWCAWKRGNEILDPWAHPDFPVSALEPALIEKKPEKVATKLQGERRSARATKEKEEKPVVKAPEVEIANKSPITHATKSAPGPRRIACEACRKRRIRCKHKDSDDSQPTASPVQRFGIKSVRQPSPEPSTIDYTSASPWAPVAVMTPQDTEPAAPLNSQLSALQQQNVASSKVKACDECRKSKRRCVHDEFGNVDPIKASQTPVPRAYSASKRARPESDIDQPLLKRIKSEGYSANNQPQDRFSSDTGPYGYLPGASDHTTSVTDPTIADHLLDPSLTNVDDQTIGAHPAYQVRQTNIAHDSTIEHNLALDVTSPHDLLDQHFPHADGSLPLEGNDEASAILPDVALASSALEGLKGHKLNEVPGADPPPPDVGEPSPDLATTEDGPISGQRSPHGAPPGIPEPLQADSPRNRSRTPSLRVQTNSDESNAASGSAPSSPLTELEPSSPVAVHNSEEYFFHSPALSQEASETIRGVDETIDASKTPKATRTTLRRTPTSIVPLKSGSRKKTPASNHTKKQSVRQSPTAGLRTSSMDTNGSPTFSSPEEDASMKLIRQMQEQEFGLRRRS